MVPVLGEYAAIVIPCRLQPFVVEATPVGDRIMQVRLRHKLRFMSLVAVYTSYRDMWDWGEGGDSALITQFSVKTKSLIQVLLAPQWLWSTTLLIPNNCKCWNVMEKGHMPASLLRWRKISWTCPPTHIPFTALPFPDYRTVSNQLVLAGIRLAARDSRVPCNALHQAPSWNRHRLHGSLVETHIGAPISDRWARTLPGTLSSVIQLQLL